MKALRLGTKIVTTLFRDQVYYPGRLFAETLISMARCGILLVLYSYVFSLKGGNVAGLTYQVAAWSMFLYFALLPLRLREVGRSIMRDVQTGTVELLFTRPISYLTFRYWWQLGAGLYPALVIATTGTLGMLLFVGAPDTMSKPLFFPSLIITAILGCLLTLSIYSIVGLLAFWLEDVNLLYWIVDKSVMILGGAYLPVALFPDFMKQLALYSPFGASYLTSHTVYGDWEDRYLHLISVQILWVLVCGLITAVLHSKARARVSVNGG